MFNHSASLIVEEMKTGSSLLAEPEPEPERRVPGSSSLAEEAGQQPRTSLISLCAILKKSSKMRKMILWDKRSEKRKKGKQARSVAHWACWNYRGWLLVGLAINYSPSWLMVCYSPTKIETNFQKMKDWGVRSDFRASLPTLKRQVSYGLNSISFKNTRETTSAQDGPFQFRAMNYSLTTKSPSSFLYPVDPEMIRKVFLSFVNLTFLEVTKTLVDDSVWHFKW